MVLNFISSGYFSTKGKFEAEINKVINAINSFLLQFYQNYEKKMHLNSENSEEIQNSK